MNFCATSPRRMADEFVDPYIDPKSGVLRNRFGITDARKLATAEGLATAAAARRGVPGGDFDAAHVQAIHKHLFGKVYDWAGKLRTDIPVMTKGQSTFLPGPYIPNGLAEVHRQVKDANYLRDRTPKAFAIGAARIMGDLNFVHPFREGNGRMQYQFLKQLGARAGYRVDLRALNARQWMRASIAAHDGRYGRLAAAIYRAIDNG